MAEIMLVGNPRRRGSKKRRRKMSALQRKYFGGGRASNPKRRKRRRKSHAAVAVRRRRSNPSFRRSVRRRRRNPSLRGMAGGTMPMLRAGLLGATGALGLDLLWGQASKVMPVSLAGSAIAQYASKLICAMVIGFIGGKVLRGRGTALAAGAATVVIHDALKAQVAASFPSVPLGEYLTFAPAMGVMPRAGQLMSTGMGEYLSGMPDVDTDMSYQAGQGDSGVYGSDGLNGSY